jgi:hypothetical protein
MAGSGQKNAPIIGPGQRQLHALRMMTPRDDWLSAGNSDQNTIYRGILEVNGPPNWRGDYAQAIQNVNLSRIHHDIQGFAKLLSR